MARAEALAVTRWLVVLGLLAAPSACGPALRMCNAALDCRAHSLCVAGRCVAPGVAPAIATARRLLYEPVAIGYVRQDRRAGDPATPAVATLGRAARGNDALVLLRFSIPLTAEVEVLEAYVLIDRVRSIDADPAPVALHVAQVIDRWDARSLSWAVQPRTVELGSPVTRVLPASGALVRLDVHALVERWRQRRSDGDPGLAILAERASPTGMAFALAPSQSLYDGESPGQAWPSRGETEAPRLELYVR